MRNRHTLALWRARRGSLGVNVYSVLLAGAVIGGAVSYYLNPSLNGVAALLQPNWSDKPTQNIIVFGVIGVFRRWHFGLLGGLAPRTGRTRRYNNGRDIGSALARLMRCCIVTGSQVEPILRGRLDITINRVDRSTRLYRALRCSNSPVRREAYAAEMF